MLRVRETPLKSIDQAIRGEFTEIFGFNLTKFPFIDEVLNGTLVRLQAKLLKRSIRRNTRGEGGGGESGRWRLMASNFVDLLRCMCD